MCITYLWLSGKSQRSNLDLCLNNTTLKYENITRIVNDRELYNSVEIGDYVEVDYYESVNGEHRKIIYPKKNNSIFKE